MYTKTLHTKSIKKRVGKKEHNLKKTGTTKPRIESAAEHMENGNKFPTFQET